MKNTSLISSARRRIAVCAISACLAAHPAISKADDEPSRGRLPDGRAFRTDLQGHKLVDYIAELELGVESLTRRVHGLEDELSEKNAAIERLEAGKPVIAKVVERDLTGKIQADTMENPPARAPAKEPPRDPEAKRLEAELVETKKALEVALAERAEKAKSAVKLEETLASLQTKLESSERALESEKLARTQVAAPEPAPTEVCSAIEKKMATLETEVAGCNAKLESATALQTSLSEATARGARLEVELREARAELAKKEEERLALIARIERTDDDGGSRARASFAALESTDSRSLQLARVALGRDIAGLNALVATRDDLYSDLRKLRRDRAAEFEPSRLVSDRGHSIGYIASKGRAARRSTEIRDLREELATIRGIVERDISHLRTKARKG